MDDEILNYIPQERIIEVDEIIGLANRNYMIMIFLSSSILLLYVLYTNFFMGTKLDILAKHNIDVHELAILPAVMLVGITAAYLGWI